MNLTASKIKESYMFDYNDVLKDLLEEPMKEVDLRFAWIDEIILGVVDSLKSKERKSFEKETTLDIETFTDDDVKNNPKIKDSWKQAVSDLKKQNKEFMREYKTLVKKYYPV